MHAYTEPLEGVHRHANTYTHVHFHHSSVKLHNVTGKYITRGVFVITRRNLYYVD